MDTENIWKMMNALGNAKFYIIFSSIGGAGG